MTLRPPPLRAALAVAAGKATAPFVTVHCRYSVGLSVVGRALLLIDPGCIALCFIEPMA